jgi:Nuclease-related domain
MTGAATVAISLAAIVLVLALKRPAERWIDVAGRWRLGAAAEQAVGETLDQLRGEGFDVRHDIEQAGEGNIDHLVIGPTGAFLIETKATRYLDRHLVKAKRQAAKVHDDVGRWVVPVICLHRRKSQSFEVRGVWIVPHAALLDWIRGYRKPRRRTSAR